MDCKAHRKTGTLEIKSLQLERHCFDEDLVIAAFAEAIKHFSHFQQCDSVTLTRTYPAHLTQRLRTALEVSE